jgi:lysozyme
MDKNILKYEDFLMEGHFRYIDSLLINESVGDDVSSYLRKVFQRIKNLSIERKKSLLIYALTGLLMFSNSDKILSVINSDNFIKSELVSTPELKDVVEQKLEESPFKDATVMKLSQDGWDQIKAEEGDPKNPGEPVLKAYKIGDGKITVGWGHAEPVKTSKYKKGQVITREEAKDLLKEDLKSAADGVRRIFKEWKDEGIERRITQDQFNALVSMAYNMGVGGLRRSDVIQHIKKGDYKTAGESIKKQSLSKKFSGLESRREREADLFLSYLEETPESPISSGT